MKRYIVTLILSPLLLLFACTPADREGVEDDIDTLGVATEQELNEFRAEVDESLAEIDIKLDSLEAWAETASADIGEEVDSTLASLRVQRDAVQRNVLQLGTAAEERFEDVRADIEREVDELEDEVDEAWTRYTRDDDNRDAT